MKTIDKHTRILHLDFSDITGTIVPDKSGHGSTGVIRSNDAGGTVVACEEFYGHTRPAVLLPGGREGGYIELPDGFLKCSHGITISFWCQILSCTEDTALFSIGQFPALYMKITSLGEGTVLASPCVASGGQAGELPVNAPAALTLGRWYHITVVLTAQKPAILSFYLDGEPVGRITQSKVSSLDLMNASPSLIGRGPFTDFGANARYADFQVYQEAFPTQKVHDLFHISDAACALADKQYLDKIIPEVLTEDIVLPKTGPYGTSFHYKSSDPQILGHDGKVNRPASNMPDQTVCLAILCHNGVYQKPFPYEILIPALPSDQETVLHDAENIYLPELHSIFQNLDLPAVGEWGSEITWESSQPDYCSADGQVIRPEPNEYPVRFTLTAAFRKGQAEEIRTYQARILPQYPESHPLKSAELRPFMMSLPAVKKASSLPLDTVSLQGDNIFTQNYVRDLDYLLMLDPDRMLYNFRVTFGEDTRDALPLGGWEEPAGLLRGHSTGHYLSALAHAFASSGDSTFRVKLDYIVKELRALQIRSSGDPADFKTACTPTNAAQSQWSRDPSTWGVGYLCAYPPDPFALLEQSASYAYIWAPYYGMHKLLAGLLDCHLLAGNVTALLAACGIGRWVQRRLSSCSPGTLQQMWDQEIAGDYGGMNESLAMLAQITGDSSYLETAQMFDNRPVFDSLSRAKDTLAGHAVNQYIPQVLGALNEYEAGGDSRYFKTAFYFWQMVAGKHTYSIGGIGRGELFQEPGILAGNIDTNRNCETCAAYNMLKLTRQLYLYSPDQPAYMEYYERTLFNQILGSQNPVITEDMHHGVTYMMPIGCGEHKDYGSDYDDFTCCHGTGMENHVKYQESIYFVSSDEHTLYVNLYMPSTVYWAAHGITITQRQAFPSNSVSIKIGGGGTFTLKFRIPSWCRKGCKLYLNGQIVLKDPPAGSYASMTNTFQNGDVILIDMPYSIYLDAAPDQLDLPVASVKYGPLVMVGLSNKKDWITLTLTPDIERNFTVNRYGPYPTIDYHGLTLIPMYAAHNVNYHTYFKIMIP